MALPVCCNMESIKHKFKSFLFFQLTIDYISFTKWIKLHLKICLNLHFCAFIKTEPPLEIELWMVTCELCFLFDLDCTTKQGIRSISTAEDFV